LPTVRNLGCKNADTHNLKLIKKFFFYPDMRGKILADIKIQLTKQFISEPMLPPVVELLGLVRALEDFNLIRSMLMPSSCAITWATCTINATKL
jgi:hypothetical protein